MLNDFVQKPNFWKNSQIAENHKSISGTKNANFGTKPNIPLKVLPVNPSWVQNPSQTPPEQNAHRLSENVHPGANFDPKMAAKRQKTRIFEKFEKRVESDPLGTICHYKHGCTCFQKRMPTGYTQTSGELHSFWFYYYIKVERQTNKHTLPH
jgi:hypothetical protein